MALAATATVIAVSGGFRTTVGGFRVSVRSPLATSIAALLSGAWWFYFARRERSVAADLEELWFAIERHSTRLIGGVALIAAILAATFATRSASGADASGYLSQAEMWARGLPIHAELLALESPALDGWITTPLGWRPAPSSCDACDGVQVPTYPPGLPLLMAVPHAVGGISGASAIVIACAAVAVWAAGMISGGVTGILAAALLAFSPAFIYQSIQPMSDVPVTAAWMLCFLVIARGDKPSGWSLLAGLACGIAVLVRPNLAPLAIVPLFVAQRRIAFALRVAAAGILLGLLQNAWYGSPFQSGYGSAEELFALSNVGLNAARYFTWLVATAPVLLLAPLGFIRVNDTRLSRGLAVFALLVVGAYLIYGVFDHWSYLRFLLPALAVFSVFAAIALTAWIARWPSAWRAPLLIALLLAVTAHGLYVARSLDTFKLADQLRRVGQVAEFLARTAPDNAVIVSGEQSGSMRYYTGRSILRWEAAAPEGLTKAIGFLEQSSRPVYIVLDAWENEPFLKKFATAPEVALDWPPVLEAGSSHRTRLWRISDRARFLAGENLTTIRLP